MLVELGDIRGDLQMHTDATDGRDTLEDMVAAAQARGLKYIAVTDHSQRVSVARGLNAERVLQQALALGVLVEQRPGLLDIHAFVVVDRERRIGEHVRPVGESGEDEERKTRRRRGRRHFLTKRCHGAAHDNARPRDPRRGARH